MSSRCWYNFKDTAATASQLNIITEDKEFNFFNVYHEIQGREGPLAKVYTNCQIIFRNKHFGEIKVTFLITWHTYLFDFPSVY